MKPSDAHGRDTEALKLHSIWVVPILVVDAVVVVIHSLTLFKPTVRVQRMQIERRGPKLKEGRGKRYTSPFLRHPRLIHASAARSTDPFVEPDAVQPQRRPCILVRIPIQFATKKCEGVHQH